MPRELIEASVAMFIGLIAMWFMGVKPQPPKRQGLISKVLK